MIKKYNIIITVLIAITLFVLYPYTSHARISRTPEFTIEICKSEDDIIKLSFLIDKIFRDENRTTPHLDTLATDYNAIVAKDATGHIIGGLLYKFDTLGENEDEENFYRHEMIAIEDSLSEMGEELPLPYIDSYMVVKKDYRSIGIGTQLFSKLTSIAKNEEIFDFLLLPVQQDPGYCNDLNYELIYKDASRKRYLILYTLPE